MKKPIKQEEQAIYNHIVDTAKKIHEKKVPIRKGCSNGQCHCTGAYNEIIGWRDKHPLEQ